jgi:hypothetical protein
LADRIPTRLIFSTGDDWYQVLIRNFTLSPASHVMLGLGEKGDHILHSMERGVQLESRERWFRQENQRLVAEYLIVPDVSEGVRDAFSYIGEKYDVPGVAKATVLRAFNLLRSPLYWTTPIADRAQTCSRFVMLIDPFNVKIPEWRHINRERVAPSDLLQVAAGPSFMRLQ